MDDAERFVKEIMAYEAPQLHERRGSLLLRARLMGLFQLISRKRIDPPEDPQSYVRVPVKPRPPQFTAAAEADSDS